MLAVYTNIFFTFFVVCSDVESLDVDAEVLPDISDQICAVSQLYLLQKKFFSEEIIFC